MTIRIAGLSLFLALALAVTPARAAETAADHAKHPHHTITLDGDDIWPSTTTIDGGDVIGFQNYATQPLTITFTSPKDLKDKIRCHLIKDPDNPAPPAAWSTFSWQGSQLVAMIPPGQFASVCSLSPGVYQFNVVALGQNAGPIGVLPDQGTIVVK